MLYLLSLTYTYNETLLIGCCDMNNTVDFFIIKMVFVLTSFLSLKRLEQVAYLLSYRQTTHVVQLCDTVEPVD